MFPAFSGSHAAIATGENFSHFTHSLTLHFINKAPGCNSHIFTRLQLEDKLDIQAAYSLYVKANSKKVKKKIIQIKKKVIFP